MRKVNANKVKILFALVVLFISNIYGQYNSVEFNHYTSNDGLSFGFTKCVFQDNKGFIWVGTSSGLNRFNGLTFKAYLFDSKDPNSISGNEVSALIEDSLKNMWVATNNNLCMYDRKKDNFSRKIFMVNGVRYDKLFIISLYIDNKGYMWVGTYRAIFRFKLYNNPQASTHVIDAEQYLLNEENLISTNQSSVTSFLEDENHTLWIASFSNKLFYFDYQKNTFIPHPIEHPEANSFSEKQKVMIKDREGDFLITLEGNGLLVWDRKKDKFKLYKYDGTDNGPNDNTLFGIIEDHNGLFWVGSRNKGGVNIFNKKTGKFTYFVSEPTNPYSLSTNSVNCFYEDRSYNIWVGTGSGKGLEKYSPNQKKFQRYFHLPDKPDGLNNNNILCFTESRTGDIWIGTDGKGINRLNRKTGKFTHYENDPLNPNSISSNAIISLCEDHEGTLWFGTYNGGLGKIKGDKISAYYPNSAIPYSLSFINVWYVFEDSKQNLWVGTLSYGLDLFDRKTNRFYHYTSTEEDSTTLISNGIIQLYEDSKQNLYITSYGGVGVLKLNDFDFTKMPPKLKFRKIRHLENKNSISSAVINCVAEDKEGNIWFGSMATGIDKLDSKTGRFTNYSTRDGLPGNCISSILIDDHNILWLATDKGLAKFNPKTGEVYVFDRQDGLQNKSLQGWALKTKDGEMFFGGSDGFNSFYPDSIHYNKYVPPVIITGFKLFNQSVKIGDTINNRILLENNIIETKKLTLKHTEDFISFEFIALNYTVPEKNKYSYMLEGFDKEWIDCGTKHEATYTNLDPGKYTFRVKASNNDGVWNTTGTSIQITILPPWWETIGFRILAIILIISASTGLVMLRFNSLMKQKLQLEKTVQERTREIEEKNKVLVIQTNQLYEVNSLLEERSQFIEEQNVLLVDKSEKLTESNILLSQQKAHIEQQSEELKIQEEKLRENIKDMQVVQESLQKQVEENLIIQEELSKEKYLMDTLMNTVPDFIYFKDLNSIFIKNSQSHAKLFGFDDPKALVGKSDFDFFTEEHARPAFEDEMRIIESGIPIIDKVEKETHANGRISYVSTTKMPLYNYKKQIVGTFGVSRDITDLVNMEQEIKQRNEELQTQAESLTKSNELLQDSQARIEEQSEAIQSQADYLQETNELLKERQEQIEKQSAELTNTNQELTTLNATKDKFFSIIAHDLKNPFNNILGFCDLLVHNFERYDDSKKKTYIVTIHESSKNIYKLLENLLQWARSQTGTLQFNTEEFLLNELISVNMELVRNMLLDKNLGINCQATENLRVFADKNMINTVIRNLITNAIKFTENGEISINALIEEGFVRVLIEDTGIGMNSETLENLFSIGSSKSTKGTRGESGTGLGLILCKEFVEKNGGKITVDSKENQGTRFSFTIPVK